MALFSIATTPRCWEGATPFPWLLHFILNPYLILLSINQGGIKYHFPSLWYNVTCDWTQISRTIGKHSTHFVPLLLFCAAIRIDSVSLLRFHFPNHIHVFSWEISPVCPIQLLFYSFLVPSIVALFVLMLSLMSLADVLSLLVFLMLSWCFRIDGSTQSSILTRLLPPSFLNAYWLRVPVIFSMLFIPSAFLLCSFCSHIVL